ncbi:hypothetical protein [Blastococcus sp. SYSU DS1024]
MAAGGTDEIVVQMMLSLDGCSEGPDHDLSRHLLDGELHAHSNRPDRPAAGGEPGFGNGVVLLRYVVRGPDRRRARPWSRVSRPDPRTTKAPTGVSAGQGLWLLPRLDSNQ